MDAVVVVAVLMHNKVIIGRIWQPEKPRNIDTNPSISAEDLQKKARGDTLERTGRGQPLVDDWGGNTESENVREVLLD